MTGIESEKGGKQRRPDSMGYDSGRSSMNTGSCDD
jgi:hypothetical protein